MTVFYFVRHGQIEREQGERGQIKRRQINPADPPLSVQGRVEAEQVATYLRPRPIMRLYASPLRRAQETAAVIAAALELPVQTEPRLRERVNFGDLPGQSFEEFAALWERCSRERDFMPPVGDSSRRAGQRVEAFVADVYAELPEGEVAAVAHGGIIADFLLNVATITDLMEISAAFAAQPYAGEVMRNGSITVVEYRGADRYTVKAITLTGHLLDL
jgi:broad specificity phosphatase PhoE